MQQTQKDIIRYPRYPMVRDVWGWISGHWKLPDIFLECGSWSVLAEEYSEKHWKAIFKSEIWAAGRHRALIFAISYLNVSYNFGLTCSKSPFPVNVSLGLKLKVGDAVLF